jgi:hypothetical protein
MAVTTRYGCWSSNTISLGFWRKRKS